MQADVLVLHAPWSLVAYCTTRGRWIARVALSHAGAMAMPTIAILHDRRPPHSPSSISPSTTITIHHDHSPPRSPSTTLAVLSSLELPLTPPAPLALLIAVRPSSSYVSVQRPIRQVLGLVLLIGVRSSSSYISSGMAHGVKSSSADLPASG